VASTESHEATVAETQVKPRRQQNAFFHFSFRSQHRASAPSPFLGWIPNMERSIANQARSRRNPQFASQKLQSPILLEQRISRLATESDRMKVPRTAIPNPRLYTHGRYVSNNVLAMRTLRELRLGFPTFHPRRNHHHRFPPYQTHPAGGCIRRHQTRSVYRERIEGYRANLSSPESSVVAAQGVRIRPEFVLDARKDIVQGRLGCWKKG
jgi:hypothetical protein